MCQSCGMKLHCAQLSTPIQESTVGRHQYTEESCTLVLVRSLPSEQRPLCYWADHAVLPSSKVQLGCTSVASTPGLLKEAEAIFLEVLKNCRKTLGARALAPQSFCFSNLELPTEVKHSYTLTCANSLGGLLHEVVSFVVRLCALFGIDAGLCDQVSQIFNLSGCPRLMQDGLAFCHDRPRGMMKLSHSFGRLV